MATNPRSSQTGAQRGRNIPNGKTPRGGSSLIGGLIGAAIALLAVVLVGMPLAIGHRNDLPLERLYGDYAVSVAAKLQAGNETNPLANNSRVMETGRAAYTGSCAICHGAAGDGKGLFGEGLYPNATDLRGHDTQEKSDAELFWIIKNGISFVGMPGFANHYDDQTLWALVTYTRALGSANPPAAEQIPAPTTAQLAVADPTGSQEARGAAVYFAQGCNLCHGVPGETTSRYRLGGGRETDEAVREGRRGMPAYDRSQISDQELQDLIAYIRSIPSQRG